jgi:hypothetical protein
MSARAPVQITTATEYEVGVPVSAGSLGMEGKEHAAAQQAHVEKASRSHGRPFGSDVRVARVKKQKELILTRDRAEATKNVRDCPVAYTVKRRVSVIPGCVCLRISR